jgi:hypothetical protein
VVRKYKQGEIYTFEFLFWILVWFTTAIIIIYPAATSFVADILGIGRGADLILYTGLLIVFYLIFRLNLALDHIQQEITEVVRSIALAEMKTRTDEEVAGTGEREFVVGRHLKGPRL